MDEGVGVNQCVDVMNVVTVLSPLENTTTAVLVSIPLAAVESSTVVKPCTEPVAEYVEEETAIGAL